MNDVCQCGFNSSNLLSADLFSFTCDPTNPSTVTFEGFIYGFSVTNDENELLLIFNQWVSAVSPVDVFGDILYTGQCGESTSSPTTPPPPSDSATSDDFIGLITGVTLGIVTVIASIIFVGVACFVWGRRKCNQAPAQSVQMTTCNSPVQMNAYNEPYKVDFNQVPIQTEHGPIDPGSNPMPPYNPQYTLTQDYYKPDAETPFPPTHMANMP